MPISSPRPPTCRRSAEAARDGVDVRLLVPGSSDVPVLQPVVRAGYRSLIEAGIRVFEWNGSMLHAKTAVADGRWARVGSTNLNMASWATNWELDVVVEDEAFGAEMEAMYLEDLTNATEIVPGFGTKRRVVRNLRQTRRPGRRALGRTGGASAVLPQGRSRSATPSGRRWRIALTDRNGGEQRRYHRRLLLGAAALITLFPVLIVSPIVITLLWFGIALLARAFRLGRRVRARRLRREESEAATTQLQAGNEALETFPLSQNRFRPRARGISRRTGSTSSENAFKPFPLRRNLLSSFTSEAFSTVNRIQAT